MKKAGFVALIGEPNAGKSTLLNHFVALKFPSLLIKFKLPVLKLEGL